MKKIILFCVTALFTQALFSCGGFYYKGKVVVVNNQMEPIKNINFWQFTTAEDSFKLGKNTWINPSKEDTMSYSFYYGYGGWGRHWKLEDKEKVDSKYTFRIEAEGYADVVISKIKFKTKDWSDSTSVNPVLYIVMQTHQYETVGNTIKRIEAYHVKESIKVKDTLIFKMPNRFNSYDNGGIAAESNIKSYPNPVIDQMQINYTNAPLLSNSYMIRNYLGQEIKIGELKATQNNLDLSALKPGSYILEIEDENGNISYLKKFIKVK